MIGVGVNHTDHSVMSEEIFIVSLAGSPGRPL
jgi:hypothetical protein